MKKLIFLLFPVLVMMASCKPTQLIQSIETNDSKAINSGTKILYKTVVKDSVVIRDSVVIHPDGSISKFHNERSINKNTETLYIRSWYQITTTIKKTWRIIKTIEVEKKLTWSQKIFINLGKILTALSIIIIIYKLNKKLLLWQNLTKGL